MIIYCIQPVKLPRWVWVKPFPELGSRFSCLLDIGQFAQNLVDSVTTAFYVLWLGYSKEYLNLIERKVDSGVFNVRAF